MSKQLKLRERRLLRNLQIKGLKTLQKLDTHAFKVSLFETQMRRFKNGKTNSIDYLENYKSIFRYFSTLHGIIHKFEF